MESVPKRVTAFVGTARKKNTYNAVRQVLDNLKSMGTVEDEIVVLNDHRLGICRGCKTCSPRERSSVLWRTTETCSSRR